MKSNFAKLPSFVGGAVDFGMLSSATNLSKTLIKSGCSHVEVLKDRKEFESSADLGESSGNLTEAMRSCGSLINNCPFWLRFGRANARSLAEARRAVVH
jgi:hypothetical protein